MMPPRRVAAIVLPRILCEIAISQQTLPSEAMQRVAFGVVMLSGEPFDSALRQAQGFAHGRAFDERCEGTAMRVEKKRAGKSVSDQSRLDAVNDRARKLGLCEGLSIAEGRAYFAEFRVYTVDESQVRAALGRVAEVALGTGPRAGIAMPDVVWLDLTGAAHLAGGEARAVSELAMRVSQLGHMARVVVADGPRLAEAIARHGTERVAVVPVGQGGQALRNLPVSALPLDAETAGWLLRVGVVTVADLARLARDQVAARLGEQAREVLSLIDGHDPTPIEEYVPPRALREEARWEEGVEQHEPIMFVLKRLTARLAARLQARGEATGALVLTIDCDKGIARLNGVQSTYTIRTDLPAALCHADDLFRVLKTTLEQSQWGAPVLGIAVDAPLVTRAPRVQLDLSRHVTASPDALPVLLADLTAEIGPHHVGVLSLHESYRPEARSRIHPVNVRAPLAPLPTPSPALGAGTAITRILPLPMSMGALPLASGRLLICPPYRALEIQRFDFDTRLHAVDWWTPAPLSRDYLCVWAADRHAGGIAWVYTDPVSEEVYLHGWID